jgi:cytochrome c-type biogenesis protein CcmE
MSSASSGRRRAALIVAGTIVLGAFGYLLFGGLESNVVYFLTPQELLARGERAYGVPVRLGGQVAPGSVQWDAKALDLRFKVIDASGSDAVVVHSRGAPPQMFRDGMGVVVEGEYGRDGVFQSKHLMIRHSEEYRAPAPGQHPQEMYKSLMKDATS